MERFMYQDDSFEHLLKQKADEYRMYPSDRSWKAIQKQLNRSELYFYRSVITVLIVTFTSLSIITSTHQDRLAKTRFITPAEFSLALNQPNPDQPIIVSTERKKSRQTSTPFVSKPEMPSIASGDDNIVTEHATVQKEMLNHTSGAETTELLNSASAADISSLQMVKNERHPAIVEKWQAPATADQETTLLTNSVTEVSEPAPAETIAVNKTDADLNYEVSIPMFQKPKLKKHLQLYITPSVSYRVLISENKFSFGNSIVDPESAVLHKSSTGWEMGATVLLPVSKKINFRTGIQYNYTKYLVFASKSAPEVTTVALNYFGSMQRITTLTNNPNFAEDVPNETMQLSIPIGIEYHITGDQKVNLYLATNIQPSYLLKATGYLITSDYKNYIKAPDLLSRMNLNTALETFIRWNMNGFQLQAGPQLRYQIFSNSDDKYPIKEHLVDYGFKLGFIKTIGK